MEQLKKEIIMLKADKQSTTREIDGLQLKQDKAEDSLRQTVQREKGIMADVGRYNELKKVLSDTYGMDISETKVFAKLMCDFKIHGYNASAIINEYNSALSLRLEVADNERKNRDLYVHRAILNAAVSSLQFQVNTHRQTINAVSELASMGLGLKELKQLWRTVLEIADSNSIPCNQAVSSS
jgi:hypothetical protein